MYFKKHVVGAKFKSLLWQNSQMKDTEAFVKTITQVISLNICITKNQKKKNDTDLIYAYINQE